MAANAEESASDSETEELEMPWAIAATWTKDGDIVAAVSSGLPYRSGRLQRSRIDKPNEGTEIGVAENSLWTAVELASGGYLSTDYSGGIHMFSGGSNTTIETGEDSRWCRAAVAVSDELVAAGTQDGKLLLIDVQEKSISKKVDLHEAAIFDLAVSSDGETLASVTETGEIALMRTKDWSLAKKWNAGQRSLWAVAFVGEHIVAAGADRTVHVFAADGQSIASVGQTSNWISQLAVLPGTSVVLAGTLSGEVLVLDVESLHSVGKHSVAESGIWGLQPSADGDQLLVATRKAGVSVVDIGDWTKGVEEVRARAAASSAPRP
ncbi:MAG TPA: hypothetical protein DDW52_29545 [Planctomycetaceae bacterium]|nr:hypothetical protein [Planctomycetaceae bacterium]